MCQCACDSIAHLSPSPLVLTLCRVQYYCLCQQFATCQLAIDIVCSWAVGECIYLSEAGARPARSMTLIFLSFVYSIFSHFLRQRHFGIIIRAATWVEVPYILLHAANAALRFHAEHQVSANCLFVILLQKLTLFECDDFDICVQRCQRRCQALLYGFSVFSLFFPFINENDTTHITRNSVRWSHQKRERERENRFSILERGDDGHGGDDNGVDEEIPLREKSFNYIDWLIVIYQRLKWKRFLLFVSAHTHTHYSLCIISRLRSLWGNIHLLNCFMFSVPHFRVFILF